MKKRLLCLVMILGLSVTACGVDGKVSKNGASVKKGSKVVVKDKAGNVTKLTVK